MCMIRALISRWTRLCRVGVSHLRISLASNRVFLQLSLCFWDTEDRVLGAYILSTLHEASKDPAENYGFSITYRSTHQDIRLTTYSMRNKPALPSSSISTPSTPQDDAKTPTQQTAIIPLLKRATSIRPGSGMLSQILSASAPPVSPEGAVNDLETVSFKALPVLDVHPDQIGVAPSTCRDAARRIVRDVVAGCRSVGVGHDSEFVVEEDIVRYAILLVEAIFL
jgi:hypothetical protein